VFGGDLLDVEYAVFEGDSSVGTWQVVDPPVDAQLGTLRLWDWPMSSEPLELSGISDIPRGWALCDGSQSTFTIRVNSTSYTVNCPDLRERFIRGPGLSLSTGGHESTVHEHGIPYTTVDVRGPESGYTPETIRQVADLTDPATLDNLPPYMDYQIIMRVQ
jgi:hypothetical protein